MRSRHDAVRKSIERLVKREVIELPSMAKVEQKQSLRPNNKTSAYVFSGEKGKRDSLIVVAQLSPEFTGAIVDRWIELEKQVKQSANEPAYHLPTTYLKALEQLVEKEKKLLAAQPKINYYDKVVDRSTLHEANVKRPPSSTFYN